MPKRHVTLSIEHEILEQAKKQNINISKTAEEALINSLKINISLETDLETIKDIEALKDLEIKKSQIRASLDEKIQIKKKAEYFFQNQGVLWDRATAYLKDEQKWTGDPFVNDKNRVQVIERLLGEKNER